MFRSDQSRESSSSSGDRWVGSPVTEDGPGDVEVAPHDGWLRECVGVDGLVVAGCGRRQRQQEQCNRWLGERQHCCNRGRW